ncbi:zinc carboxypeptidase [Hymenobacter sedentarius]|uniref:Zinc carboxypeptidase n=1 Tax=Hymenobacter sedentarius TaxID=1411621 RepID=A0A0U4AQT4_9BACT|nr:M14 family metallopeptidase [Hymenobacter sedentarius]ALW85824.1 zinc carboxypeptidase [Hymenobacter sedentarius]
MRKYYALLLAALITVGAQAQTKSNLAYYLPQNVTYNPAIPTPAAVLGYEVGEWHASHDQLLMYMRAVDAASDRVTITEYARTHENRPLLLLTITSPENQRNIAQIKADHHKLTDPAESGKLDVSKMPAVLWMGYSVHGNEPSGTNASLLAVYYLAAAQGPAIDEVLRNTVVLVDPSINPDGMTRFSSWVNSRRSKNLVTDPANVEQNEAWPGGRFNHYWFDLNRDWLPLQHPESRGRLKQFHEWKPNLLTDHHEMGTNSTFFFQPGVVSRKHPLTPDRNFELTQKIGAFHAKALDKIGSLYFTEENYDDFYYGKGSTYPDVNGAVGILFEQASSRGHAQEGANGVVRFPFTIRNQVTTTLSSIEAMQALRVDLLNYQRDFYQKAAKEASGQGVRAYVFGAEQDPARSYELARIIRQHQIAVYRPKSTLQLNGRTFNPADTYVVPTDQPQFRLIQAMFEERSTFKDSIFYDISAWTLPRAFGLDMASVTKLPKGGLLGQRLDSVSFPVGKVTGDKTAYAYAFSWHGYYAPRALNTLLARKLVVKVATEPFSIGERKMDYGTIMVPVGVQTVPADTVFALMQQVAAANGLEVVGITTGLSAQGLKLGSVNFVTLKKPEIMLLAGPGVSPTDVGEAWHLLDQRFGMTPSLVAPESLDRVNLDRYTVIVASDGTYNGIPVAAREKLRAWVQRGNTLLAMGKGAKWLANNGLSATKFKASGPTPTAPETASGPAAPSPTAPATPALATAPGARDRAGAVPPAAPRTGALPQRPYVGMRNTASAQEITGAIFHARLDLTHPLGYGYDSPDVYLFRDHTVFMERSASPYANPLMYTAKPLASGFISKPNELKLRSTAAADVADVGAGRIISLVDNPNFRAFWYGTNKLFLNSVFFGQIIRANAAPATEE